MEEAEEADGEGKTAAAEGGDDDDEDGDDGDDDKEGAEKGGEGKESAAVAPAGGGKTWQKAMNLLMQLRKVWTSVGCEQVWGKSVPPWCRPAAARRGRRR